MNIPPGAAGPATPRTTTRAFLTAAEAYPALEQAFLNATSEIWGSFHVFDLTTQLRSAPAKAVGTTWFDLVVHTLKRGVAINYVISDFDPIAKAALHRGSWRSVRMFHAAAAMVPGAKLKVAAVMHAAEAGFVPRLLFWPAIARKLRRTAGWLNGLSPTDQQAALRDMPGVRARIKLGPDGSYHPRLWPIPRLFPGTHHQKLAVIDRKLLYIGGLDLDERRFDTPDHDRPGDETWHDVQLMVEGPVVSEAQAHLESFLAVVAGKAEPVAQRRLLRTLSRQRSRLQSAFLGPEPVVQEIAAAHEVLARRAERLIYIETQYFRDRHLARVLAQIGRDNPRLGLIILLPAAPDDVAFERNTGLDARFGEYLQGRCLRKLARGFGSRLFVGGAAQPRRSSSQGRDALNGAPIIYIHAKVSIFDDRSAIVSSANLNGRSLRWDTEAGVFLNIPRDVMDLRHRVMAHWLPRNAHSGYFAAETAVQAWRDLAVANARTNPESRRGFILPYDLKAAEAFGHPVPVMPDNMV